MVCFQTGLDDNPYVPLEVSQEQAWTGRGGSRGLEAKAARRCLCGCSLCLFLLQRGSLGVPFSRPHPAFELELDHGWVSVAGAGQPRSLLETFQQFATKPDGR